MTDPRFLRCAHCGNLVGMIHDAGVPIICCGEPMKELSSNTVDASHEKHLPVVTVAGNLVTVSVGSVPHPMTEEHWIEWAYLKTDKGGHRKNWKPSDQPAVTFAVQDETPIAVYAYCNLHGLWKTEL